METGNRKNSLQAVGRSRLTRRDVLRRLGVALAGLAVPEIVSAWPGSTNAKAAPATRGLTFTPPVISAGSHSLKILMWTHFVPAFDAYFENWAKEWGQQHHVTVTIDHVPTMTVSAEADKEAARGTGHDLIQFQVGPDPHVFASISRRRH